MNQTQTLEKTYNPKEIEQSWYQTWEKNGYFKPDVNNNRNFQSGSKQTYTIVIPPPNVTGSLHMGHAFQYTLMDILIRYNRMNGKETLWQMGTDAAGIATQMVVERQLNQQNIKRTDLSREEFVDKVWQWKEQSGNRINEQIKRLGASVNWDDNRFTMDEGMTKAVNKAFVELYNQGLIYRGERLVNWDPVLHTALSDLEVENIEKQGNIWHIKYPIENSDQSIVVATTRPETMLGDAAVAVNPHDERYINLIGKNIVLPLTNRKIPIIADHYVDQTFGTGAVKITPAHDFNDFEVGKRHNLPLLNILTIDANLNTNVPEKYQGLTRELGRKQVLADLDRQGYLVKTEAHNNKIPMGDRSGAIIEPYLVPQWYVKVAPLAEKAREVVNNKTVQFVPENYVNMYNSWMNELQDWCISRQLWWGNRIPAWYDKGNNIYVAETKEEVIKKYNLSNTIDLTQEQDTLDTWFAASLWPAASLGWPDENSNYQNFYPTNVLITGFDIIFFWVARMIMMGLHFNNNIPFRDVYITGLIRDSQGQKMSKSKGNIIDPLDLIDGIELQELLDKRTSNMMQPQIAQKIKQQTQKEFPNGIMPFGCDALRFTLCALASHSRNINFDLKRIEGYRNFCNKLWNAARFVLMNTEGQKIAKYTNHNIADQWILSELQHRINKANDYIANYRFDLLAQCLYEYIWDYYCDWYLELSKADLNNDNNSELSKANTRFTLLYVLENILRLLHPIIPFITEEIWQRVNTCLNSSDATSTNKSIMLQNYPAADNSLVNPEAENKISLLQNIIVAIRNIRGEMNVSPAKKIDKIYINGADHHQQQQLIANLDYLKLLSKIDNLELIDSSHSLPACATGIAHNLEILVPMAGLIDVAAESARLNKEITKLEIEHSKITSKLDNQAFVAKAPQSVVDSEKNRLQEITSTINKLKEQQINLAKL